MANPYSEITTRSNGEVIQATWFNTIRDTLVNNGAVKHVTDATAAPQVTHDNTQGYESGSTWTDATNEAFYFCVDATTGAAVWRLIPNTASNQTFTGSQTFAAPVTISDTTTSTSKDTGCLITEGGVGIEENLNVGGNAVIDGDLTVSGTTTTIDTATLDVTDANITVNDGGNQATADSNDAGLTVEMSDATDALMHYDSTATSKWKCGELGSTVEVADIASAQTLTNKTLTSPNVNEAVALTSTSTELNQLDGVTVGGVTSGDITTIDGTQTLTNKTLPSPVINTANINMGTASDTQRLVVPKDTTANLDLLTDTEASIAYDTTLNSLVVNSGSGWGSSGGITSLDLNIETKSAAFTATLDVDLYVCTTASGYNITLPTAVGNTGKQFSFVKVDATNNVMTLNPALSQTINGDSNFSVNKQWSYCTIISDGANWIRRIEPGVRWREEFLSASQTTTGNVPDLGIDVIVGNTYTVVLHVQATTDNGTITAQIEDGGTIIGVARLRDNSSGQTITMTTTRVTYVATSTALRINLTEVTGGGESLTGNGTAFGTFIQVFEHQDYEKVTLFN